MFVSVVKVAEEKYERSLSAVAKRQRSLVEQDEFDHALEHPTAASAATASSTPHSHQTLLVVNRHAALVLWAAIVAQTSGMLWPTALTLGSALADWCASDSNAVIDGHAAAAATTAPIVPAALRERLELVLKRDVPIVESCGGAVNDDNDGGVGDDEEATSLIVSMSRSARVVIFVNLLFCVSFFCCFPNAGRKQSATIQVSVV